MEPEARTPPPPRDAGTISALRRICTRLAGLSAIAVLAACSAHQGGPNAGLRAGQYAADAPGNYKPPGPPGDPWGPYIEQASTRFDVPTKWIRQVMRVESGGHEYLHGRLTMSSAGAMGLMQLEPQTYREMAARYGLGPDPFNPYDNIMAGTAYIHEMYQIYGSPGFLAAYNAGPGRLDNYLDYKQPLPRETRNYVAMIAPNIAGVYPSGRAQAEQVAMYQVPAQISPGLRPGASQVGAAKVDAGKVGTAQLNRSQLAMQRPATPQRTPPQAPVRMAALSPPPAAEPARAVATPVTRPVPPRQPHHFGGFSLIPSAEAATPVMDGPPPTAQPAPQPRQTLTLPVVRTASARITPPPAAAAAAAHPVTAHWGIQVGAYDTPARAKAALGMSELAAVAVLMKGQPVVQAVSTAQGRFYRARFVNLGHEDALAACRRLGHGPTGCAVLSPDAN